MVKHDSLMILISNATVVGTYIWKRCEYQATVLWLGWPGFDSRYEHLYFFLYYSQNGSGAQQWPLGSFSSNVKSIERPPPSIKVKNA